MSNRRRRLGAAARAQLNDAASILVPGDRSAALVRAAEAAWREINWADDELALTWILVGLVQAERRSPKPSVALRLVPSVSSVA